MLSATEVPLYCARTIPNRQGWCVPSPLLWTLVVWCIKVLSLNNCPGRSTLDQILLGEPRGGSWVPGLTRIVNHCGDLTKCRHVQPSSPSSEMTTCGVCRQSKLPASLWPHEGISRALFAGAGMFHRLGEKQEAADVESSEAHTLTPPPFMDWASSLALWGWRGGPQLMGGVWAHCSFGTRPVRMLLWPWPH